MKRPISRLFLLASALIVLSAVALRLPNLARRSLWYDEAVAANISRGSLGETLALTQGEHSAPITHPLILYAVERVATGPLAVRLPSVAAGVLAVVVMLCLAAIPSVDPKAAALAALFLSLSAFQIRYSQEVREYSLSVLFAALLTYLFLSFVDAGESRKRVPPAALCAALFAAPFIQYGLVLFSGAVLAALFILRYTNRQNRASTLQILTAALCLASGCLLSFLLTLRYQWRLNPTYLKDYFFDPGSGLLHFIAWNTQNLMLFLLPGQAALWISAAAILCYLFLALRARTLSPLVILSFTAFGAMLAGGLLRAYPFGPTRQCLFLAPVFCLLAATGLVEVTARLPRLLAGGALAVLVCITLVSAAHQSFQPHAEFEDIQTVLAGLRNHVQPGDAVYIYGGAVPAIDYYIPERDPRFIYGHDHHFAPEQYAREIESCLPGRTQTAWIVVSHVRPGEDRRMVRDMSGDWDVTPVLFAEKAALYQARRRAPTAAPLPGAGQAVAKPVIERTALTGCFGESFWDWNQRLMSQ